MPYFKACCIRVLKHRAKTDDFGFCSDKAPYKTCKEALAVIERWKKENHFQMAKWWVEQRDSVTGYIVSVEPHVNIAYVKDLWAAFGDVPMDPDTETLDDTWGTFPKGTHREDVWHWFEDAFSVSVERDLMYMTQAVIHEGLYYEIVDAIPKGYLIWPIHMAEGYLPLCMPKPPAEQPFEGACQIRTDTLKAIRLDGAEEILSGVIKGTQTVREMRVYIKAHEQDPDFSDDVEKMRKAIPLLEKVRYE